MRRREWAHVKVVIGTQAYIEVDTGPCADFYVP